MPEVYDPNPEKEQKRRNRLFGGKREEKPCQYQPFIDGNVAQTSSTGVQKKTQLKRGGKRRRRGNNRPAVLLDDDLDFQFSDVTKAPVAGRELGTTEASNFGDERGDEQQHESNRQRKRSRFDVDDSPTRKAKTVTPSSRSQPLTFDSKTSRIAAPDDAIKIQRRIDNGVSVTLEEGVHVEISSPKIRAQDPSTATTSDLLPFTPPTKTSSPRPSPVSCKVEELVSDVRFEEPPDASLLVLRSSSRQASPAKLAAAGNAVADILRLTQKKLRMEGSEPVNAGDDASGDLEKPLAIDSNTVKLAPVTQPKQGVKTSKLKQSSVIVRTNDSAPVGEKMRGKEVYFVKKNRPKQTSPTVEETSDGSLDMTMLLQRLEKKHKRLHRKRSRTTDSSSTETSDQITLSSQSLVTPKALPVTSVVTQQSTAAPARRRSPQEWMTKLVAESTDVSSPLKGSPFQNALRRNNGVLDRESFRQQSSLRVLPVVKGTTKYVHIEEECGWRSVQHNSLAILVSDIDAVDRLQWEAALLKLANSRQEYFQLPIPVKLAQFKKYAALTVELKDTITILGTLADVFELHCTFGMLGIPEAVVGWLVIKMAKILNALHEAGIAHNQLGLDSFLVTRQGGEWDLVLIGLGSKGVVRESGDLFSHFLHDRFSTAAIIWAYLTGGRQLSFTQVNGKIHVDNIECITASCFLRGVDGWDALFHVLLNPTWPSLIPKDTLRLIESIVYMGRPGDSNTTVPIAVKAFFESLMGHKEVGLGGIMRDSRRKFSRDLGISSDELLLRLQLESFSAPAPDESPETCTAARAIPNPKSVEDPQSAEGSQDHQEETAKIIDISEPDPEPIAVPKATTKARHAKRAPLPPPDIADLPARKTCSVAKRPKRVFESLPAAETSNPALKRRKSLPQKRLKQKGDRRLSSRIQTKTNCGMKGCKNEYEVGGGYMWVMKIPPEDEGGHNLPNVPIGHPMHLLCLKCRPCKEIPIVHPKEILSASDKSQIDGWEKYLYYKASKVDYGKMAHGDKIGTF